MVFTILLFVSGCSYHTQTTSSDAYLDKHQSSKDNTLNSTNNGTIEDKIREVAAVEPTLTFPARIGVARINGG